MGCWSWVCGLPRLLGAFPALRSIICPCRLKAAQPRAPFITPHRIAPPICSLPRSGVRAFVGLRMPNIVYLVTSGKHKLTLPPGVPKGYEVGGRGSWRAGGEGWGGGMQQGAALHPACAERLGSGGLEPQNCAVCARICCPNNLTAMPARFCAGADGVVPQPRPHQAPQVRAGQGKVLL